jgi:uncharacterized protein
MVFQEKPTLLIIGASCRAAAWSARRAGYPVATLDLFADRDVHEIADSHIIRNFPESIVEQAREFRSHRIVLAGGMENFPSVIAELEKRHPLVGPNANQIIALRSLNNLQRWTKQTIDDPKLLDRVRPIAPIATKFPSLAASSYLSSITTKSTLNHRWLRKSRNSAGGLGVGDWNGDPQVDFTLGYLQERLDGECLGVVVRCTTKSARFIGATRNRAHEEFVYGGSEGPIALSSEQITSIETLMRAIATEIGYEGLLQADFILAPNHGLYLLEINPRWSAGLEVIELTTNRLLMGEYMGEASDAAKVASSTLPASFCIKHIWYAPSSGIVSPMLSDWMMAQAYHQLSSPPFGWADIPSPNTQVIQGHPIATLIATSDHSDPARANSLIQRLQAEANQIFVSS